MRTILRTAACLLASALACSAPAGAQASPGSSYDAALRWEGARHGTLGPTGARLFALELADAPGCRGRFGCGDAALVLADPLRLELLCDGEPLVLEALQTVWFPSHLEARWRAGALELFETKLITDADVIVDELVLTNAGSAALDLELCVQSGAAWSLERSGSQQRALDLAPLAVVAQRSGTPLFSAQPATRAVWVEAEQPFSGTSRARVLALRDASGLRAIDGFGLGAGERLEYALVAPPLAHPELRLRCATRAHATRVLEIELDGRAVGRLEIPPAGAQASWSFVAAPLAALQVGAVRIALITPEAGEPLCLDGFFLAEADEPLDALPVDGAYTAHVPEQLALPEGELVRDGVRFVLPAQAASTRPTIVALRGGTAGDPAQAFPERARLELPAEWPAITTLHVLCASALPRGARPERPAAHFVVEFEDGSSESLAWPAAPSSDGPLPLALGEPRDGRVDWHASTLAGLEERALALSYLPPPGRCLRALELVSAGGPEVPLLLAATLEVPRASGRLPLLVASERLDSTPVELVLALENGIPGRSAAGEHQLEARIQLAAGASLRTRALLATGERGFQTALQALDLVRDERLVELQLAESERWFDEHVPGFRCSDAALEQAWRARWYSVRRNLLRLDLPDFSLPVAYEGTCCAAHARISPAAASLALRDLRWLRGIPAAQGTLRALLKRQQPGGLILPTSPSGVGELEIHELAARALDVFAVDGSPVFLKEVLGLCERDLDASLRLFDPEQRGPPLAREHGSRELVAPLDLACHLFASASALARGQRLLGETLAAQRLEELAARLRRDVLAAAWDPEQRWFTTRGADGKHRQGRGIDGFLPFASGLAPLEPPFLAAFASNAGAQGAVAALPGSLEEETWMLDALARLASAPDAPVDAAARLSVELARCTRRFLEQGSLARAVARAETQTDASSGPDCVDLLRGAYADLLVRCIAGLVPREDGVLELRPLVSELAFFQFTGLPYRGRRVDVSWRRPGETTDPVALGVPEGFTLAVDGKRVFQAQALVPFVGK